MSEQQQKPKSFMQELDDWTITNVIGPLVQEDSQTEASPEWESTVEQVQKAVRTKVLESYRNGQAAGPTKPRSSGFIPRRQPARA